MGDLTRSELEAEITAGMGGRTDITSARMTRALNMAQDKLSNTYPFQELHTVLTLTTVEDQATNTLTSIPRDIHSVRLIDGTHSRRLIYKAGVEFDYQTPYPAEYTTDRPTSYTIFDDKIEWWRVPDNGYTIYVRMVAKPTNFTTSSDVVSSYRDKDEYLISYALSYLYRSLGNKEKWTFWEMRCKDLMKDYLQAEAPFTAFGHGIRPEYTSVPDYWRDPFTRGIRYGGRR